MVTQQMSYGTTFKVSPEEALISNQIRYIYDSFNKAINATEKQLIPLRPLIVKGVKKLYSGFYNVIEIRGSFTEDAAVRAFFKLKENQLLAEDSLLEIVFNKQHTKVVTARFAKPCHKTIRRN